jgi:hypothetical protein
VSADLCSCGHPSDTHRKGRCQVTVGGRLQCDCFWFQTAQAKHEHEWGEWYRADERTVEPGDVTRSRWCACGAYEMWTKNDPVVTSRDLSYRVEVPGDNER